MRNRFAKTIVAVDDGSLGSAVQARDLLRNASELRIPSVVLVGGAKQLDAVDTGSRNARGGGAAAIGDWVDESLALVSMARALPVPVSWRNSTPGVECGA